MTYITIFHNPWGSNPRLYFLPQNLFLDSISFCGHIFSFSPETALERRREDRGKSVTGLSFGFSGIGSCHSWLALGILSVIQLTGVYQWAAALGAVGFLQGDFVRVYAKHCPSPRGVLPFSVCPCCDPSRYFLS